jgi:hypothetical protein
MHSKSSSRFDSFNVFESEKPENMTKRL